MTGRNAIAVAVLLLLAGSSVASAAVEVGATLDRERARVGEQIVLQITVTGEARDVSNPQLPELEDFRVFSGGQSQRFSFVNGRASAEHTFTYYLQPLREGHFTIDPIRVRADGQNVATVPLDLEVLGGNAPDPDPDPAPDDRAGPGAESFVLMTVDRDSVVVGEQVVLTFGFYRATRLSAFESPEYTPPRTEGFWREDLPPERHTTRVIRSRRYQVTEIQYALFPTRAGALEIGEAVVRLPDDALGSFLRRNRSRSRGPRVLRTDPLTIHVTPLPQPAPDDFTGTVATELELDAAVDRRDVDEGEAVTLTVRMSGVGNIPGASVPALEGLEEFRVHDAGGGADKKPQGGRLRGVRVVESLLVPREPGRQEIPAIDYTYFDTDRREYVTLRTEPIELMVRAVEGGSTGVYVGGRKNEIELLARDILHIAPLPAAPDSWPGPLPHRGVFYGALGAGALGWVVSTVMARRHARLLADPRRRRAARARVRARAILDGDGGADERVVRAIHGWAADRFDRAAAGLTHEEVLRLLTDVGVDSTLRDRVQSLVEKCDAARYAPLAAGSADDLVDEARTVVDALEEACRAR